MNHAIHRMFKEVSLEMQRTGPLKRIHEISSLQGLQILEFCIYKDYTLLNERKIMSYTVHGLQRSPEVQWVKRWPTDLAD